MKRFMVVLTALLIMLLPITAGASVESKMNELFENGSQIITTIGIEPGQSLADMAGDQAPLAKAILDCFNIAVKKQKAGDKLQFTFGLDIDKDRAADADIVLLIDSNGIYLTSSLIDNKVLTISFDDIISLIKSALNSNPGLADLFSGGLPDMSASIKQLIEKLTPVFENIGNGIKTETLNEKPDGFENAVTVITITVTRKDLDDITNAFADALAAEGSLFSTIASVAGWTIDAEQIRGTLSQIGNAVQGDIVVEVYTDEAGVPFGMREKAAFGPDDDIYDLTMTVKAENGNEEKVTSNCSMIRRKDLSAFYSDCNLQIKDMKNINASLNVRAEDADKQQIVSMLYTVDMSGQSTEISENIGADIFFSFNAKDIPETASHVLVSHLAEVTSDSDAYSDTKISTVLGADVTADPFVITDIRIDTAPAGEFIDQSDAVSVLKMTNDDMNALMPSIYGKLAGLISKLPEEILRLLVPSGN